MGLKNPTFEMPLPRRVYEMSQADLELFRKACSPPTDGGIVLAKQSITPAEAAKQFWIGLAARMNFKWWTVQPYTSDPRKFTAIPATPADTHH